MAATEPEAAAAPAEPVATGPRAGLGRLAEARWLIVGIALVLLVLLLFGRVTVSTAAIVFIAVIVLVLLIPRTRGDSRLASRSEPAPVAWPETGVKLFADALPDPAIVLDRRGIVRYANSKAITAFRFKPGEPLAYWLRAPDLNAAFDRVSRGGPAERVEFVDRVPTERWFGAWFSPLGAKSADGRPDFVVVILDDLSEGRRVERIRADFVANASHELRTPLASLAGFIETLQGPARDDPEARSRFLSIMHEQASRMSRLINDLLSLSRIELKAHLRPSDAVDLTGLVRHVADALEPLARELDVAIETDLPTHPVIVRGDRDELIQVFENLIENACKYGQSGKRVEIALRDGQPLKGPAVSVRDFGPGIASEHLPRLTERFYRADGDANRQHRGTGLGLAITKHILARHEARLNVESELGEGALFEVVFPVGNAQPAPGPTAFAK
jgi:two-component system phosphate regulon sensor histidine kinase PhoR